MELELVSQVLRRLAQNREAARKSRLRKKVNCQEYYYRCHVVIVILIGLYDIYQEKNIVVTKYLA